MRMIMRTMVGSIANKRLRIQRPRTTLPSSSSIVTHCFSTKSITTRHDYASVTSTDVAHFRSILRPEGVQTDPEVLAQHNVDWMKKYVGRSSLVLKPKTTTEVSQILSYCHARRIPVVPQGGNTGLVGGSVPVGDEVILSLSSMNQILSFDAVSGILTCEAGCILENVDTYVGEKGYMMPLDLGAKGSCQVGQRQEETFVFRYFSDIVNYAHIFRYFSDIVRYSS